MPALAKSRTRLRFDLLESINARSPISANANRHANALCPQRLEKSDDSYGEA